MLENACLRVPELVDRMGPLPAYTAVDQCDSPGRRVGWTGLNRGLPSEVAAAESLHGLSTSLHSLQGLRTNSNGSVLLGDSGRTEPSKAPTSATAKLVSHGKASRHKDYRSRCTKSLPYIHCNTHIHTCRQRSRVLTCGHAGALYDRHAACIRCSSWFSMDTAQCWGSPSKFFALDAAREEERAP